MAGRPKINLEEYFTKIRPFLQLGYTFHKACLYAQTPYTSMLPHYNEDEKFRNRVERERTLVNTVARKNIVQAIKDGDVKTSMEWLETQEKEDFSKRSIVENINPEQENKLNNLTIIIDKLAIDAKQELTIKD